MSEVFSFRLNPENPRESAALAILIAWKSRGYSIRHVLTEALIQMRDIDSQQVGRPELQTLNAKDEKLISLLELFAQGIFQHYNHMAKTNDLKGELSDRLISSIKHTMKPGLLYQQSQLLNR